MKEIINLKNLTTDEIVGLVKAGKVTNAQLTDNGICPTCFDKENNHVLYGDASSKMLYEDEHFECFLVGNPRAQGHSAISTKKHYKDYMELDSEMCTSACLVAKELMNVIREVYECESVYLCTMCDGPMNHFHLQLIPRYKYEERGSDNFVKPRQAYVEDLEKIQRIRLLMQERMNSKNTLNR